MYKLYLLFFYLFLLRNSICTALDIHSENDLENCTVLKDNFAKTISEFTMCSINYSRPITICKGCIKVYVKLLESYENMSKVSLNGTECLHYYINLDRLQILETQYSNSINLWDRAKCYECYVVENGTQTCKESEMAKTFHKYYKSFNMCTQNTNAEELCTQCMDDYVILSNFYERISNANERIGVCIDLEDLMNGTWNSWSVNCCKYRKHNEYIFIISTSSVLVITILLYIVVQFCGEKKAPTIIQQSRLAGSINRF